MGRLATAFPALRSRDFRLFFIGQLICFSGNWMQQVAHAWLVLQLSNSPFIVGVVTALSTLPILLFTLYGGVVADRVRKRPYLVTLRLLMALEALGLGGLILLDRITVGWIMFFAVFIGLVNAFEVPARQAFVVELVGKRSLMNAIALNSSAFNLARVLGPVIAGTAIATIGLAACFFANAASYLAVVGSLLLMRHGDAPPARERLDLVDAFREGARYVWHNRWPRAIMVLTAVTTIFGFSFLTMLAVFARDALQQGAGGYGVLVSAVGIGALGGALGLAAVTGRVRQYQRLLTLATAVGFGAALLLAGFAPNLPAALGALVITGCLMALHSIAGYTMLQQEAPDPLRGRVVSFYSFVVMGMAPFGSFLFGWQAEHLGIRATFAIGGAICLLTAIGVWWRMKRDDERRRQQQLEATGEAGLVQPAPSSGRRSVEAGQVA